MADKQTKRKIDEAEKIDVDTRFLLANERTLLSWVRTALALMAGGIAISQLGEKSSTRTWLGIVIIATGASMALLGYIRFIAADKAIRSGTLPSMGNSPKLQVLTVLAFAAILVGVEVALL